MSDTRPADRTIGRYAMCAEIAAGGMATVHLGKLLGPVGFSRVVAIKALHPQFARDPDFLSMFLDEARLAGRVRHPNVVSVFDVVAREGELYLIMDYVPGETLARLSRFARAAGQSVPLPIAVAILIGALEGLHAAHEARDEHGHPLGIVHRDISPQNVLVGSDGTARILDFGVAKAVGRMQTTRNDQLKGKLAYMAPEQLLRGPIDRTTDVYAASIVLWELLTGLRLYQGESEIDTFHLALEGQVRAPSEERADVPAILDAIVARGLAREPSDRFETARAMAQALEDTRLAASAREVASWVESVAHDTLAERALRLAEVEQGLAPAALQREIDPQQAAHDASLLRKIDARAVAELDTDIVSISQPGWDGDAAAEGRRAPSRRKQAFVVVVAFAAAALLAIGVVSLRREPVPAVVAAAPASHPPPSASAAPDAPPVSAPPAPSAAASGVSLVSRPAHGAKSRHRPNVEPKVFPANAECANPFTLDDHGVRIPKRQCL